MSAVFSSENVKEIFCMDDLGVNRRAYRNIKMDF